MKTATPLPVLHLAAAILYGPAVPMPHCPSILPIHHPAHIALPQLQHPKCSSAFVAPLSLLYSLHLVPTRAAAHIFPSKLSYRRATRGLVWHP
ncbi:hypothetical protein B0H17DRAFT_200985 [Mycena rosella]|uniref:Secreted protein n=1 Tax=Mycena rosella TaxID=1033263 RepID=A0AAD7CYZ9_MYCRO|nr:hypothetical protein B0H17DRAFT_200985 [Mycena rosella]